MKLSLKILLTALFNVALLAVAFLFFLRLQFHSDFSSFMLSPARDRILAMARLVALEMEQAGSAYHRDEILFRYGQTYNISMALFTNEGVQLAGPALQLPDTVRDRLDGIGPLPNGRPPQKKGPPGRKKGGRGDDHPLFVEITRDPSRYWVGARIPVFDGARRVPGTLLLWTESLFVDNMLFDFRPLLAGVAFAGLITVLCWLPLIRGLTRSIAQVTAAAGHIAEGSFDIHVDDTRGDELGRLGAAINRMAGRLQSFVQGQKRFLGDIAHELSAPVARMQLASGMLEQQAPESMRSTIEDLREEVQEMSVLVHELLSFSKAGLAIEETPLTTVNLASIVEQAAAREASGAGLVVHTVERDLTVLARPEYLARALANLIRNGIRHGAGAGPVNVSAALKDDSVLVTVADSGPGVPVHEIENIFAPFYRLDEARTRESGGTGLGLAIVKSCVEACQGTVTARNLRPAGFAVTVGLKRAESVKPE